MAGSFDESHDAVITTSSIAHDGTVSGPVQYRNPMMAEGCP